MRALITGARGFVGGHLIEHLTAMGDEVITTDRSDGGPDLLDGAALGELVGDHRPDAVYHLAGQADVAASWGDPVSTFRINAEGTLNLLLACRDHAVERVLVVTSAEVYGLVPPGELPITEDRPLAPTTPYAASKAAAEMLCSQWATQDLGVIRARAFNHLGPGQSERFVAPAIAGRILRAAQTGDDHIAVGNLETRRDFTDVRDVVRAYRLLVQHGVPGEAYNVCSGVDVAIAEVVDLILEATGRTVSLRPDPALQRPSDLPVLRGDASKLSECTDWTPDIDLTQTIADMLQSLQADIDHDALSTNPGGSP